MTKQLQLSSRNKILMKPVDAAAHVEDKKDKDYENIKDIRLFTHLSGGNAP